MKAFARVSPDGKKWGMIDLQGNNVLEPVFEDIHSWSEGFVKLEKISPGRYGKEKGYKAMLNGQFGFMNMDGDLITDFSFGAADNFHNGFAAVSKNKKWGFINTNGELAIPYRFSQVKIFHKNTCMVKENSKWGIINTQGDWVLKNQYHNLSHFTHGLAFVEAHKKRLLIDMTGNIISTLPHKYTYMEIMSEKLIAFGWADYHTQTTSFGLMDLQGKIKSAIQFYKSDAAYTYDEAFINGQLIVENEDGERGIINDEGILIVPMGEYKGPHSPIPFSTYNPADELINFSEGLAIAKKDNLWGVIDENHNTVVDYKFQTRPVRITDGQGLYFSQDYPQYAYGLINIEEVKDGVVYAGYMDKQGNIAIELKFRKAERFFGKNKF
ncbi:hypothetical protein A4H97_31165 [Niastella yeongjuensis]|uniref:WG repeat-containing protein n=1 Tax=Niastella yeongjuensis TaxID=354355 RepID=A0A1V9EJW4_9BACT|nr:WG repeat-containing protein [Niastella yeongjuensis]OQP46224.1 hypothetical protein A4H97_31165 [Niastella yeongjuensis]SEP45968.1 WG containing repeat-containing protein [Niastella yeongjuensis]